MLINPNGSIVKTCAFFVLAFYFGSARGENKTSTAKADEKPVIRVVEEVFDHGWKTARETAVKSDGSYRRINHRLGSAVPADDTTNGKLPDLLMEALQVDFSKKEGFKLADGVHTYRFGIDDSLIRHPKGIAELLRFLADENSAEVVFVVRFKEWPPRTESDRVAENQLRVLLAHPRFRRVSSERKGGGLEFRIRIQDTQDSVRIVKTGLTKNDGRWSAVKNRFSDVKIDLSGSDAVLFGREESVILAAQMIGQFSTRSDEPRGQDSPKALREPGQK